MIFLRFFLPLEWSNEYNKLSARLSPSQTREVFVEDWNYFNPWRYLLCRHLCQSYGNYRNVGILSPKDECRNFRPSDSGWCPTRTIQNSSLPFFLNIEAIISDLLKYTLLSSCSMKFIMQNKNILTLHQALFSGIFKSVSKMLLKHTNWWLIITKINGRYSKNNYLGFFRNL